MDISDLSYFQTIDMEKAMGAIELHRTKMISELSDLCGYLPESIERETVNAMADALESFEAVLDCIWEGVKARQEAIELADSSAVLALR